jgi:hypothetical protein
MNRITTLKDGSGVGVTLLINNKEEKFRLGVFASKDWSDKEELEYGFVNEDETKFFFGSLYSGGESGFGLSDFRYQDMKLPEGKRLVTTDSWEIHRLAQAQDNKAAEERANWLESQAARVAEINKLPKEVKLFTWKGIDFYHTRNEATFNASYSRKIQYYTGLEARKSDGQRKQFYLSNYISKSGAVLIKNFINDFRYFVGEKNMQAMPVKDLKVLVEMIKTTDKQEQDKVRNIIGYQSF